MGLRRLAALSAISRWYYSQLCGKRPAHPSLAHGLGCRGLLLSFAAESGHAAGGERRGAGLGAAD